MMLDQGLKADTEPPDFILVSTGGARIPVLARVRGYPDLRQAIAARRHQLGLSQLVVDDLAGLHSGYLAKLERPIKHFGDMSLAVVLATLGLEILIVPTDLPRTVQDVIAERRTSERLAQRHVRSLQGP